MLDTWQWMSGSVSLELRMYFRACGLLSNILKKSSACKPLTAAAAHGRLRGHGCPGEELTLSASFTAWTIVSQLQRLLFQCSPQIQKPADCHSLESIICEFTSRSEHLVILRVFERMNPDRKIGLALDYSASSKYALKWAVDNLVREGDQLVVLVVQKEFDPDDGQYQLFGKYGAPLIPLVELEEAGTQRQYNLKDDEDVQSLLKDAVSTKKATVVFKVYWGDPKEHICKSVSDIPLDFLVMGCRGLSALKRTFMGSVSNYVSNSVTCPVTIVKLPPNLSA